MKAHSLLYIAIIFFVILGNSCRKDFNFENSTGNLSFSKDTVYLDTVFSTINSSTYGFKVYNKSNTDVQIPKIELAKGVHSYYKLNVDGQAGDSFTNTPLYAKDSLYIFVEIHALNVESSNFLYTDAVLFDSGNNTQKVELVSLVKDAIFLFPTKFEDGTTETIILTLDENNEELTKEGFALTDQNLNFTANKPYVIYGYATIPENETLTIEAGARIYFHKNSGILIKDQASIQVNGKLSTNQDLLENEVIFEADRLEPSYKNVAGQWGGLWFTKGSINNSINYATIKNASIGIYINGKTENKTTTLTLSNTQIYNSLQTNVYALNSNIDVYNCIIANAGFASLQLKQTGTYNFNHTTIANYWTKTYRTGTALQINNTSTTSVANTLEANFTNSIIDGNATNELLLLESSSNVLNFKFTNCIIKFDTEITSNLYNFKDITHYILPYISAETAFINPLKHNFEIKNNSAAIDNADKNSALKIPLDINGNSRTSSPDIGAYEFAPNN
ncbi:hypothetical protein M4I21_02885 [Cellulophaga sp. 20_2_10]|uniref:choice-of-anchor Q domain-containing protein n=1 Tax=Cellulophaga sp. 20_2_10 TaxID=2942476 RepID=UPI00201AB52E|nr:choice-of-anchor Q domain-containing protein [Cellulophaga sp. 20_2_10]MCL5244737.1 hypothetical protein [Cellulophaga sp. 20_2_10]